MAKQVVRGRGAKAFSPTWQIPFTRQNFIYFAAGIAVIIAGFLIMLTGNASDPVKSHLTYDNPLAIAVAPIILVIGYCVIIPLAILKFFKRTPSEGTE
ncbi:MAG: DUF3098 domain-containing protein [Bacteroidota bacterium]